MGNLKITYKNILETLSQNGLLASYDIKNPEKEIEFISHDSRNIAANTLFFCKGEKFKDEYLYDAIQNGAVCYASELKYGCGKNYIIVNNILRAIALIAPLYYGYPYKDLNLIGITGTKGKTTTAYFLRNILDEYTKSKTGLSSSIEKYTGKRSEESHLNTPEPCDLQQLFYEAKESGIKYFTMEVSSQAYKRDRALGVKFDNGIFLNIAEDHISPAEHENFEDYFGCKLEFLKNCANIVINRETAHFDRVMEAAQSSETLKQITIYGGEKYKGECDYYFTDVTRSGGLLDFCVKSDKYDYSQPFSIIIPGLFNIENATVAVTMCKTLGVSDADIRAGLLKTEVPGRMTILEKNGVTVVVDYAHNLLSFGKLYEALSHDYAGRKIISVGGSPGGKAYSRRKEFAETVGVRSDYIYLTAEDPQFEDVTQICEEMAGYMPAAAYETIADRGEAVKKAISGAKSGDVVVLLGKGAEEYQKVRGNYEFYESDFKIAQRILGV